MLIYLAQLTHKYGIASQNRHFPLAIGYIGGYLKQIFRNQIEIQLFKYPDELNTALKNKMPDVLMMSNYMWNLNLNLEFTKKVKEHNNNVLTVMGGPNISLDEKKQRDFLNDNPYIDLYVLNAGEAPSALIINMFLQCRDIRILKQKNIHSVISKENLKSENKYNFTGENRDCNFSNAEFNNIPSPYIAGLMDKFFEKNTIPLIETNRGCPFTCAFCQQGNKSFSKLCNLNIDRVKEELSYISNKIHRENFQSLILEIADSNFAMYKRDAEIIRHISDCQVKYSFPKYIYSSTGKNKWDIIIENLLPLESGSVIMRIAIQSMNQETLKAIKRKNIKIDSYRIIQEYQQQKGIRCCADLMLGLPRETLESHIKAIFELIDWGMDEFCLLQTIILKGTEIEKDTFRDKYEISSQFRPIPECMGNYEIFNENIRICEYEEIITGTNTMSFNDYLEARKLHLIVMIFHNTSLLNPIYKLLAFYNVPKSRLIQTISKNKNMDFCLLLDNYITDTKTEISSSIEDISLQSCNIDDFTSNKIYKHLSCAFFQHKGTVISVITDSLLELIESMLPETLFEVSEILNESMISLKHNIGSKNLNINFPVLRDIFGTSVSYSLSENQQSIINLLNETYTKDEDKLNKMVYHLRPVNLCYSLNYL